MTCVKCNGAGHTYEKDTLGNREYRRLRVCECHLEARARRELRRAGFPCVAVDSLDTLRDTTAVRAAKAWSDGQGPFLVLLGDTGAGKSWGAVLGALDVLRRRGLGGTAGYALCSTFSRMPGWRAEAQIERLLTATIVLIDDVGAESTSREGSGWWAATLHEVVDVRLQAGLRTIITSNLTAKGLEGTVGARVWDRLQSGTVVECLEQSMRTPGGER